MITNIVIASIDRKESREVAEIVAEQLGMHVLDTIELFEFDNIPRSLGQILEEQGEQYFRKKEKSLSGYVSEFENTVISVESGCVLEPTNIEKLKTSAIIVYLNKSQKAIKEILKTQNYANKYLAKFYNISLDKIRNRVNLWKNSSDIVINTNNKSSLKVGAEVIRAMEEYFLK